jgi:hypothetical protein
MRREFGSDVTNQNTQRLIAVFCGGLLLLNFPLLGLWDVNATVFGVPLFPVALFGIWAMLIVALAWLMERGAPGEKGEQ